MDTTRQSGYAPIGAYGLIGDGQGCGLVALDGSIDWLAVPRIDTPPLLAAILDAETGGHFSLRPSAEHTVRRRYLEGTLVLETTFETGEGSLLRVTDALNEGFQGQLPWTELVRRVEAEGGPVAVDWELRGGTRFARARPWPHEHDGVPYVLAGDLLAALVLDELGDPQVDDRSVRGTAVVHPGTPALATLVVAEDHPLRVPSSEDVLRRLDHTVAEWRAWSELIEYDGPHRDQVIRSVLTIKALMSKESGALAASPTTSLPEVVGSDRNFDYRFAWVRDASFMLDVLNRVGLSEEVDASLSWLLRAVQQTAPSVRPFYRLDGRPASGSQDPCRQLEGYRGSAPVMLGNKAAAQKQHGAYGDLLGAVGRYVDRGGRLDTETGLTVARLVDKLCDEWPNPDAGIWELGTEEHYTSSLINGWAALDRAVRLADRGEVPAFHVERWRQEREAVHAYADQYCWSDAKSSYTFYAGTDGLDAAAVLAARTGFLAGDDPRLSSTIDAVRRELTAEGPWLYRYSGASEEEHTFVACTFWVIEAMCFAGRVAEAGDLLDAALEGGNDLDLWSEEKATGGALLGNFPIGISHLAVAGAVTAYAQARKEGAARADGI